MMTSRSFWKLIEEKRPSLTKKSILIADYLLQNSQKAEKESLSEMANSCGVADASIYRFCRQLGFSGYAEMKIALAQTNVTIPNLSSPAFTPEMSTKELIENTGSDFLQILRSTTESLLPESIDQAAELLRSAENVYCIGEGSDADCAESLWISLFPLSGKYHFIRDTRLLLTVPDRIKPQDVLLLVSLSHPINKFLPDEFINKSRKSGARIIQITSHPDFLVSDCADVILCCGRNQSSTADYQSPLSNFERNSPFHSPLIANRIRIYLLADILFHRCISAEDHNSQG